MFAWWHTNKVSVFDWMRFKWRTQSWLRVWKKKYLYIRRKKNKPVIFNTQTRKKKYRRMTKRHDCELWFSSSIFHRYLYLFVDILTFIPLFILFISPLIFETFTLFRSLFFWLCRKKRFVAHFFLTSYRISCLMPKLNVLVPLFKWSTLHLFVSSCVFFNFSFQYTHANLNQKKKNKIHAIHRPKVREITMVGLPLYLLPLF